jgi:hypothetical protein
MATDPTALNGLFKETYGDDLINLIPESAKLTKMIPFISSDKELGNKYHSPVIVTQEHGVTYAAADAGAFALNDAVAMQTKDAYIQGSQILLRGALSYDAAARASSSKKAFKKATQLLVENMLESGTKRVEIAMLHGMKGIGHITQANGSHAASTYIATMPISAASWATGIWAGMENAYVNVYADHAGTPTLVSSSTDAIFQVTGVDVTNHYVYLTGTATGISAITTAIASYALDIYFKGAYGAEMYGLNSIITNTGSLFGISATTYALWAGNNITVTGQLTMSKVLSAVGKCVQRGLNEDAIVLVNPDTWANLASDLAALRRYDGSYSKSTAVAGSEALEYHGQNGKISIESYNICKAGEAYIFPPKKIKRPGAQDLSFKTPGRGDDIFTQLGSNAGFEIRVYTDQAVLIETPAQCAYISGFTNA